MNRIIGGAGALLAIAASPALAQSPPSGSVADLRAEMTQRYDAALAMTQRPDIVAADDSRYLWSSEAKVACAIAIGYLKNRIADADWIARCRTFADRMTIDPQPPQPPQPPIDPPLPPRPDPERPCTGNLPVAVFFDWDSAVPLSSGDPIIREVVGSARACGWTALRLVGHTDRSGDVGYNLDLSRQRAAAVADALVTAGFAREALTTDAVGEADPAIATADGVREPQNRRVAIDRAR